jgi:hypothetical protein
VSTLRALADLARRDPGPPPPRMETCELCGHPLEPAHRHVRDLDRQALACACRACALLFTDHRPGARYQTMGYQVRTDPTWRIDGAAWARLQIPVRLAFFFQDGAGRWQVVYPGAAGPVQSELDPEAWAVLAQSRLVSRLHPRSEALLVFGPPGGEPLETFLVPLDRCYALVGLLRGRWQGWTGGPALWNEVEAFFAELRAQADPIAPGKGESPP